MTIIHIYSQKKLSRGNENDSAIYKVYKEIDILYGTEIKDNPNMEFKYVQPTKLMEIECFFIEFYKCVSKNAEFFYQKNNYKLNYFDDDLINKINEIVNSISNQFSIDVLYNKLNNYLYEIHTRSIQKKTDVETRFANKESKFTNVFAISKDEIVKEFFKEIDKKINASRLNATINLSRIDDIIYDQNDNSVDFLQKINFNDNKSDEDVQPSFMNNFKNSNSSFSAIIMNDIDSKGMLNYEPIDNSILKNKIDNSIVNNKIEFMSNGTKGPISQKKIIDENNSNTNLNKK